MTTREYDVCLQMGHVARKKGGTGTTGHRGSEQDFVKVIGPKIQAQLISYGLTCALIGADDKRPSASVFLALHQDGSPSPSARGASVGYPVHGDGETLAKIWKARYTMAGWPNGFRPDNYTIGLHWYYAFGGLRRWWWKKARFDSAFLIEHGFATTVSEENWMWDHTDQIVDADASAIAQFLGKLDRVKIPQTSGDNMVYFFKSGYLAFYWLSTAGEWSALTSATGERFIAEGHLNFELLADEADGLRARLARAHRLDESTAPWTVVQTTAAGIHDPYGDTTQLPAPNIQLPDFPAQVPPITEFTGTISITAAQ